MQVKKQVQVDGLLIGLKTHKKSSAEREKLSCACSVQKLYGKYSVSNTMRVGLFVLHSHAFDCL